MLHARAVAVLFNGGPVVAVKAFAVPQPPGQQEMKQRPEFAQVIFQGRTGQAQTLSGVEFAGSLGGLAGGVLDVLRFIENQHRSEEHTSELQSLMRISYAVFCLKKKK